jgi:uncharacterized delta-60 repeat protein
VVAYAAGSTFNLARYNADGRLDTSFGQGGTGIVNTSAGKFSTGTAYSLALEPDGKIVVAGAINAYTSTAELAVLRCTAGGLLDTSFGQGGIVTTPFSAPLDLGCRCTNWIDLGLDTSPLDPNAGKIVVVTRVKAQDVVVRYNSNGTLDASFAGGAGYESLANVTIVPSVAIESNGDILVAGNSTATNQPVELDCLNPDGSFNTAFGSGGIALAGSPNTYYAPRDVTTQSNGQIVVAGFYQITSTGAENFFVARFNPADGSLDASFGAGGIAAVSSGSNSGGGTVGLALEPDGRIVVGGSLSTGTGGFALARFVASGPEVGSFTASPNPVTAGSSLTLTASNILDEIPSATITQVALYVNTNGTNALLGYGTQTSPGVWTLTYTVGMAPGTYTLYAQGEDNFGIFGDCSPLTLQVL